MMSYNATLKTSLKGQMLRLYEIHKYIYELYILTKVKSQICL